MNGGLIKLTCMLSNQLANHFEVTEFLDCDVLEHVPNAGVFDVKGLHPILQRSGKFPSRSSKLLKKVSAKASVRGTHIDGLDKLFAV